jgi:hypothetical protein
LVIGKQNRQAPQAARQAAQQMFKISIVETDGQRRLVLAGKLVAPWTAEVESAWRTAGEQLRGRKLIVDLADVTVIGPDGENTLLDLMKQGAKFSCDGVLTRHVLKQLARLCRCRPRNASAPSRLKKNEEIETT